MSTVEMPSVDESLRRVAKGDPVHMRWQDYRRAFTWRAGAERPGENRLEYPAIEAPLVKGRVIMVPAGNAAPEQADKAGAVFLAVEGETEFTVAGKRYALKPLDLLIRPRQPGFEFCLAPSGGLAFSGRMLRHAREVADSRLMLAPSLVAGHFHLSQLDGMANAFCLGLSPLALEVRLMLRALCSRRRQRRVVPFLLIPECSTGAGNLFLEGATRLALLLEQPLERRLALG